MITVDHLRNNLPIIHLTRDITKHLKRGHRWISADCFEEKERMKSGLYELHHRGTPIAIGIVQVDTELRFRLLFLTDEKFYNKKNIQETLLKCAQIELNKAFALRKNFRTTMQTELS